MALMAYIITLYSLEADSRLAYDVHCFSDKKNSYSLKIDTEA